MKIEGRGGRGKELLCVCVLVCVLHVKRQRRREEGREKGKEEGERKKKGGEEEINK